ncbi:hypothetical protein QQ045_017194 [Rhodiola kirilowii]
MLKFTRGFYIPMQPATSHKWVLGAFVELLDNALDEVYSGATYVNIDTIINKQDKKHMLLIEDNGGGMNPEKMRQCMSVGFSANTNGQYVIVFSRCRGKDGKRPTQSIGLLSYTFLSMTGKEDIVVPMLDYERGMGDWKKLMRSTQSDWDRNVETIVQWSPFSTEEDLLRQFSLTTDHGTRVVIYNLWEDDQGQLELDFEADKHRYASILYLRLPAGFRIILRDAVYHIDVQGFNVYHKNRLIKPFWRVWNACGSEGRGVIGLLEANFVEPAHDKQGFERTIVLSRLEDILVHMQKQYWSNNCQLEGMLNAAAKNSGSQKKVASYENPE